jgi:hypothetical protein
MRRRRLATAAVLGLAGIGLRAAGARRRQPVKDAPRPQPEASVPAPAPAARARQSPRAADVLLLPPPLPAPARARPRAATGPRLVAFGALAVVALAGLAVIGPRGGGRRATATTAAARMAAPPATASGPAPTVRQPAVLETPAVPVLRPFPARSCRFSLPVSGWHVIWADLQQGQTLHSEAGGPGDARIACDSSAPGPPVAAARRAAGDARKRAGYRGIELVAGPLGTGASATLVYEYDEPGLGRVRVEERFLSDGASAIVSAPVAGFGALAPVFEAVLASHRSAGA